MATTKIGIIKEGKVPVDHRVPLTPAQASELQKLFDVEVWVQSSGIRCFADEDYSQAGVKVVEDITDCDILLGVKEIPIHALIPEKTYFFFSHTIKAQPYNRDLLRAILKHKIRLIDYETLTNTAGKRIIAFGRWAGIVGAYNAILTFGKRYNMFHLKPAHQCKDLEEMQKEYSKVKLSAIKIAVTGGGRVAKGAMEVMTGMNIRRVSPAEFLNENYEFPVYTQLNTRDYHIHKEGKSFSRKDFFANAGSYEGDFLKYARKADVLIASAYWDPASPVLFEIGDMVKNDFKIKVIADITCDIEGSIPSTKRPSLIENPVYDYNPSDDQEEEAFSEEGNITVMAVDNLPCELPRDASESFGNQLLNNVLPALLGEDKDGVIKRATIAVDGHLTDPYNYLTTYVNGE